jgi:hypothetical protein
MKMNVDLKKMNGKSQVAYRPQDDYNLVRLKPDETDEPEETYRVLFETSIGNNRQFVVLSLMQESHKKSDNLEAEIFELIGNTYYSVADEITEDEVIKKFKESRGIFV